MFNKILIIFWFFLRPKFYKHFFFLIKRKFLTNHDTTKHRNQALQWALKNAISYRKALKQIGLEGDMTGLDNDLIIEGEKLQNKSSAKMGGSGHIHLLHDCVRLINAQKVLETGVAYGWSSLAILKALSKNNEGELYSVDMPYLGTNNNKNIGIVVPQYLRKNWIVIKKPDRPGIITALDKAGGKIDLCHYDSDKSWWGRHYAYPILWNALNSKGLFISDDIQDNLYFCEFIKNKPLKFAVVEFKGKFVGLIRKP